MSETLEALGLPPPPIDRFTGEHAFLSNFYSAPVEYEGVMYPTVEHAFQAQKTLDQDERLLIKAQMKPADAKRRGRDVALRADWEDVKDEIMGALVLDKFVRHPRLRERLLATGDRELIEGNTWGDTYWGVCGGEGKNQLGRILMRVRAHLS